MVDDDDVLRFYKQCVSTPEAFAKHDQTVYFSLNQLKGVSRPDTPSCPCHTDYRLEEQLAKATLVADNTRGSRTMVQSVAAPLPCPQNLGGSLVDIARVVLQGVGITLPAR